MAAKRITQSSINWIALSERVPRHQRGLFIAFKTKSDKYLHKLVTMPIKPPTIDWAFYKSKISVVGMVDDFEKQFGALDVPYPPNTMTGQLDAQEKEFKAEIDKFKIESNVRIVAYQKELAHIQSLIPYDHMTMEDYRDAFPELALDPINRPTYWPHAPEDQIGYEGDKNVETKDH